MKAGIERPSREEWDAIYSLLDEAADAQTDYQSYGNPHIDHGAEWPEVARAKARNNRLVARWLVFEEGVSALSEQLVGLAETLEASAREYEEGLR
jgi:hypothetical protein